MGYSVRVILKDHGSFLSLNRFNMDFGIKKKTANIYKKNEIQANKRVTIQKPNLDDFLIDRFLSILQTLLKNQKKDLFCLYSFWLLKGAD